MKRQFEDPQIEMISFGQNDVICSSTGCSDQTVAAPPEF